MAHHEPLTQTQVAAFLSEHVEWKVESGMLARTYEARSFLEGITFVEHVGRLCEAADHHPDIDIRWRKVTLRFVTHDAGNNVTALDSRLAGECDALFSAHLKLG